MADRQRIEKLMFIIKGYEIIKPIPVHWWIGTVEERTKLANALNEWAKQEGIEDRFPVPMPSRIKPN